MASKEVSILFEDYYSIWCPLYRLCFSQSSNILVSRHPIGAVEEVLTIYCPQCLTRYSDDEAFYSNSRCPNCFQCPACCGILLNLGNGNDDDDENYTPAWTCTNCRNVYPVPENQVGDTVFADMLAYLQKADGTFSDLQKHPNKVWKAKRTEWHFEDLEQKIITRTTDKLHTIITSLSPDTTPSSSEFNATLFGIPLRTKRTVRCRYDMELGKMNILLQPKLFPLDGDSSLRVQKGKWWEKDSSAMHMFPAVTVLQAPDMTALLKGESMWSILILRITNPRDIPMSLHIAYQDTIPSPEVIPVQDTLGHFTMLPEEDYATLQTSSTLSLDTPALFIDLAGHEDELLRDDTTTNDFYARQVTRNEEGGDPKWVCVQNADMIALHIPICMLYANHATSEHSEQCKGLLHFAFSFTVGEVTIPVHTKLLFTKT